MGEVIFPFDSRSYVRAFNNGEFNEHLHSVLFSGWTERDGGEITNRAFLKSIKDRLSKDEYVLAKKILTGWISVINYNQDVIDVINQLKENGKKIFIVSNMPQDYAKAFKRIKVLKNVDDAIFSSKVHLLKPDKRIFLLAVKKFKINPEESLFIDDREDNVNSAESCGFHGMVFKNNTEDILKRILTN